MDNDDAGWLRIGRDYAWLNAVAFVVGTVLFLAVTLGLVGGAFPTYGNEHTLAADSRFALAQFNWERGAYVPTLVSNVAYLVGFLALIPLGMALRHWLGRDGYQQQLMAAGYFVGGIFGAGFIAVGIATLRIQSASGWDKVTPEGLIAAAGSVNVANELSTWLSVVAFLVVGLASWRFARLGLQQHSIPRGLAWLAMGEAALLIAGIVISVIGPFWLFQAFVGIGGGIVAPAWAAWVGLELHRAGQAQTAADSPNTTGC
jgi:hypothetical protein